MATAIIMPDFGTTVEQVKLVRWLKAVGDPVKRGDMLCEVETDKATSELESIAEGVLLKQVVPEGEDVQQGTVIAYVGAAGEVAAGGAAEAGRPWRGSLADRPAQRRHALAEPVARLAEPVAPCIAGTSKSRPAGGTYGPAGGTYAHLAHDPPPGRARGGGPGQCCRHGCGRAGDARGRVEGQGRRARNRRTGPSGRADRSGSC